MTSAAMEERARLDGPGGRAWGIFLRAHASIMRSLDRELQREAELSLADFDVLMQVSLAENEALRMSELARRTLVSRSGTTRRVAQLEELGLVVRGTEACDRRSVTVSLTGRGREILQRALPIHCRGIARHFVNKLSDEEIEVLHGTLSKVLTDCDLG